MEMLLINLYWWNLRLLNLGFNGKVSLPVGGLLFQIFAGLCFQFESETLRKSGSNFLSIELIFLASTRCLFTLILTSGEPLYPFRTHYKTLAVGSRVDASKLAVMGRVKIVQLLPTLLPIPHPTPFLVWCGVWSNSENLRGMVRHTITTPLSN